MQFVIQEASDTRIHGRVNLPVPGETHQGIHESQETEGNTVTEVTSDPATHLHIYIDRDVESGFVNIMISHSAFEPVVDVTLKPEWNNYYGQHMMVKDNPMGLPTK